MADIERSKEQIAASKAQALAKAGKHAEAAKAYGAALGDWNNAMVYRNRGWAYRRSGQPEKALADWQHVPAFAIARARVLIELGRLEEAVPELKLHLKKYADASDKAEDAQLLADTLAQLGRGAEAAKVRPKAPPPSTLTPAAAIPKRRKGEAYDAYAARLIAAAGLGEHAGAIEKARVPGVLLVPTRARAKLGGSRIGGTPDLPPRTAWPAHKKSPLLFVLQIRLEEVATLLPAKTLPAAGLLSVFVCEGRAHDEYLDAVTVVFTPGKACAKLAPLAPPAGLTRLIDGKPTKAPFGARALDAAAARKLENPGAPALARLPEDVRQRYSERVFEPALAAFEGGTHQLLGVRDRSYGGEPKGARLLLQCVTEPSLDMHWGDDDALSVFAPRASFATAAFAKATLTLGD